MRPSLLALLLGLLPHRQTASAWFLAADPHVPLAEIVDGRIRQAVASSARGHSCGKPARWAKLGSRWNTLDAWGQVVSTRTVVGKDDYDVTACAELSFEPPTSTDLTSVLVSVDSKWASPPSAEWTPTNDTRTAFESLVEAQISDRTASAPKECAAITARTRYFEVPGRGQLAVGTSNTGYLVARHTTKGWSVVARKRGEGSISGALCYRPVAVFDMNGDGTPEVILRVSEPASWGDSILELLPNGAWKETVSSPGGATA